MVYNHFFTYEESFDVNAERERARARIEEFQDRYIREVLEKEKQTHHFKEGDFILIRRFAPDFKRGKKLAIPMTGPYLITSISNAVIKAVSVKTQKEITTNLDKVYKYRGRITKLMTKMKHDYLLTKEPNPDKNHNNNNEGTDNEYFDENWDEIMRKSEPNTRPNQLGYDIIWTHIDDHNDKEDGIDHKNIENRNRHKKTISYEEMISTDNFSDKSQNSFNSKEEENTMESESEQEGETNKSKESKIKRNIQKKYELEDTESEDEYLPTNKER